MAVIAFVHMTGECLAKWNCLGCWIESTLTCFLTSTHHAWDVVRCASRPLTTSNCIQHFFWDKVGQSSGWQSARSHDLSVDRWRICWTPSVARSLILTVAVKVLLSWKKVPLIPGAKRCRIPTFSIQKLKKSKEDVCINWLGLQQKSIFFKLAFLKSFLVSSSVRWTPGILCPVDRIVTSVQRSCGLCGLAAGPMGQSASLSGWFFFKLE